MARDGDADPQPARELAVPLQRFAATHRRQADADLNERPAGPRWDAASKKWFYDYVPRPLARLLGSPLAMTGKYAIGPHSERRITGGWGDGRPAGYLPDGAKTFHKGLDFAAPQGEPVLACGDGVIRAVCVQPKDGYGIPTPGANSRPNGRYLDIYDGAGNKVLDWAKVGFGGIYVFLNHNDDDFRDYRTEYFHLDRVAVAVGQKVSEGEVIGYIGRTGAVNSRGGTIGPHLHFQVSYVAGKTPAVVNPTTMVPNCWPGHMDSTNAEASKGLPMPVGKPAVFQTTAGVAANLINGVYRSVTLQNHDIVQVRERMAAHSSRVAQVANVHETALYAAASAAQRTPPIVAAPMTFDFETGVWSDGKVT